jgi:tetratricopeptide (TPR) repeat protein
MMDTDPNPTVTPAPAETISTATHEPPRVPRATGSPDPLPPVGPLERATLWAGRNPAKAMACGFAALWTATTSVIAPVLWVERAQEKRSRQDVAPGPQEVIERPQGTENERQALASWAAAKWQEAEANKSAVAARADCTAAVVWGVGTVEELLATVQTRTVVQSTDPEVRALRAGVLAVARGRMALFAQEFPRRGGSTDTASLELLQRVGDGLRRVGQGASALQFYRQGLDLARKASVAQKGDDKSRALMSAFVFRVGEMERELRGDPRAARTNYAEALRLRRDLIEHPKTKDYTPLDHDLAQAEIELGLGRAELELGNPDAARDSFQRAGERFSRWAAEKTAEEETRVDLVRAWMWCGVSRSHLGDEAAAREALDKSAGICAAALSKAPKGFRANGVLAELLGHLGDAGLRHGKRDEARKSYDESLKNLRLALAGAPTEAAYTALLARTHERLAVLAVLDGKTADALTHRTEAFQWWDLLRQLEPSNVSWQGAAHRNLAYRGNDAEAAKLAEELVQQNASNPALELDAARCYAACAATTAAADKRNGYIKKALDAVRAAQAAGYKDHFALRTDPDLAPLRENADFKAVLTAMGG